MDRQNSPSDPNGFSDGSGQTNKTKRNRQIKIVVGVILAIVVLALTFFAGIMSAKLFYGDGLRSLLWFKDQIESDYYQDIDEEDFWQAAIDGVETLLDPYSQYYTADEYDAIINADQGIMDGTGLSFFSGTNTVVRVALNSPVFFAAKQADIPIETGVSLTGIGGAQDALVNTFTAKAMQEELAKYKSGDVVWLRFTDAGVQNEEQLVQAQSATVAVQLSTYIESYVLYAAQGKAWAYLYAQAGSGTWTDVSEYVSLDERATGKTAVLRLIEFNAGAAQEFERALEQFFSDGQENLLLDLRNNGGGSVLIFQKIAAHLLRTGSRNDVVMTAKYKNGMSVNYTVNESDFSRYFSGKKIYVAANGNTASASEALLGAMISYDTIAYEDIFLTDTAETEAKADGVARTYGKGIMQQFFYNSSLGAAVKLTTAQIFWPNGKTIHGKGITTQDGARASYAASNGEYGDPELTRILASIDGAVA